MIRYPRYPAKGRPVATFPAGRECVATGCVTILSIYNADARCSVHAATWALDLKTGKATASRGR